MEKNNLSNIKEMFDALLPWERNELLMILLNENEASLDIESEFYARNSTRNVIELYGIENLLDNMHEEDVSSYAANKYLRSVLENANENQVASEIVMHFPNIKNLINSNMTDQERDAIVEEVKNKERNWIFSAALKEGIDRGYHQAWDTKYKTQNEAYESIGQKWDLYAKWYDTDGIQTPVLKFDRSDFEKFAKYFINVGIETRSQKDNGTLL